MRVLKRWGILKKGQRKTWIVNFVILKNIRNMSFLLENVYCKLKRGNFTPVTTIFFQFKRGETKIFKKKWVDSE